MAFESAVFQDSIGTHSLNRISNFFLNSVALAHHPSVNFTLGMPGICHLTHMLKPSQLTFSENTNSSNRRKGIIIAQEANVESDERVINYGSHLRVKVFLWMAVGNMRDYMLLSISLKPGTL